MHSVQFSSVAQSCPTLCDPMNHSTPGLPVHHQLLEFTQTHVHQVSDAIQPSDPLSSPSPPAPNPSQHQSLFQWVNSSHEVAKSLELHFSIIPSKEHPGLISFRMDWLDLLAVQGTLKSLLQPHSSKASILRYSAFFTVQLSHRLNQVDLMEVWTIDIRIWMEWWLMMEVLWVIYFFLQVWDFMVFWLTLQMATFSDDTSSSQFMRMVPNSNRCISCKELTGLFLLFL